MEDVLTLILPWLALIVAFLLGWWSYKIWIACLDRDVLKRRSAYEQDEPLVAELEEEDPLPDAPAVAYGLADVAELKYKAWRYETDLLQLRKNAAELAKETAEHAAQAESVTQLEAENWELQTRLAKLEKDHASATQAVAALPSYDAQALSNVDEAGLRYRNWLLSDQLKRVGVMARAGQAYDAEVLEAALEKAEGPGAQLQSQQTAPVVVQEVAPQAPDARISEENSGLRYRNWRLASGLATVRQMAEEGRAPDVSSISESLYAGGVSDEAFESAKLAAQALPPVESLALGGLPETPQPAQVDEAELIDAKTQLAGANRRVAILEAEASSYASEAKLQYDRAEGLTTDAETLRERASLAETALRDLRKTSSEQYDAAIAQEKALVQTAHDEADALRSKLNLSETALRELRQSANAELEATVAHHESRFAGVYDDAQSLRGKLSLAETALRAVRAETAQKISAVETASAERMAAALEDTQALQDQLAEVEAELSTLREEAKRFEGDAQALKALQEEAAELRAQLWSSKWRESTEEAEAPAPSAAQEIAQPAAETGRQEPPVSGAEAAAMEFIDDAAFVAQEENRPSALFSSPSEGAPDDLKLIKGVGERIEKMLNEAGVFYFKQVAEFAPAEVAWLDKKLGFSGRIVRDRWALQAGRWMQEKKDGMLAVGGEGSWTLPDENPVLKQPQPAPQLQPVEEVVAETPHAIEVTAPLFGAEVAALELLEKGGVGLEAEPEGFVLAEATRGHPDDLKLIRGVGPKLQEMLNSQGVYYFDQLGAMGPQELAWLDYRLAFRGRVVRDRWLPQAQYWAEQKRLGELAVGEEGRWTIAPPKNKPAQQSRPGFLFDAPVNGAPDDLKLVAGVDAELARRLNEEGVYYFNQLSRLSADESAWLQERLRENGPVAVEGWPGSAGALAKRKAAGELQVGGEGLWTEPTPTAKPQEDRKEEPPQEEAPMSQAEQEALALIESASFVANAENRPAVLLDEPTSGAPDNLKEINGVGPKLEALLNEMGVFYFHQVAQLNARDIAWIDAKLSFKGRVVRDRWVAQAHTLQERKSAS